MPVAVRACVCGVARIEVEGCLLLVLRLSVLDIINLMHHALASAPLSARFWLHTATSFRDRVFQHVKPTREGDGEPER